MNDRELLELAAKAAGYEKFAYKEGDALELRHGYKCALFVDVSDDEFFYWNPLSSSGDAFRLAAKLRLSITHVNNEFVAVETLPDETKPAEWHWFEYYENYPDEYAATRRAITRAAAEIGRARA